MGAADLIANGKDVVVIEYHLDDPFETPNAVAKQSYYYVTGIPDVFFDGVLEHNGGSNTTSMYSTYLPMYEQRINMSSDFSIDINGDNSMLTDYSVGVTIERVAPNNSQNLKLMFALTESEIDWFWMGQTEVDFCERFMMPDHNGTPLDFSNSEILDFTFNFSLDTGWVQENCELAVWIQDLGSKEVQQAAKRHLDEFGAFPSLDANVKHIYTPASYCNGIFTPSVEVENLGLVAINDIDLVYNVDDEPEQIFNWSGNIPPMESVVIELPSITWSVAESSIFQVYLDNPNGQEDEFPNNDTSLSVIHKAEVVGSTVTMVLKLDEYPEQTAWELTNSQGTVLYSGGNYIEPNVFITETFELTSTDCYTFLIYDTEGDGLKGNGLYKLMTGSTVFRIGKEFGYKDNVQFQVNMVNIPQMYPEQDLTIFPNPASGYFNIKSEDPCEVKLYNINGQLFKTMNIIAGTTRMNISDIPIGLYYLCFTGKNISFARKLILK